MGLINFSIIEIAYAIMILPVRIYDILRSAGYFPVEEMTSCALQDSFR